VAVDAPTFRFAPGLSLAYTGSFPQQTALFVDGQIAGAQVSIGDRLADSLLDWIPTALPYSVDTPRQVLVIGAGGGTEVRNATTHGAQKVVAVELHPELSRLGAESQSGTTVGGGEVDWVVGDARSYVAGTRERFDLISLAPTGGFGSSAAGIISLNEDFLHTVDAYAAYLNCLTETGLLAITRWLTVPPRESVRVLLTMAEALRRVAPEGVADGIVVVRSWGTVTTLAKPAGFTATELDSITSWAATRWFDIDWQPRLSEPTAVFNRIDDPALYRAAAASIESTDSLVHFLTGYPFEVSPVTDARPYPHHFLRIQSLGGLFGDDRGSWLPFAEWGLIALLATLGQSILLALLLLVVPVVLVARKRSESPPGPHLSYFFTVGFAYMAAEIAAIQQLSLLLGHPIYAVAVVLATFLICSGFGSAWSDRLSLQHAWRVGGGLMLILMLTGAGLIHVVHLLQPAPILLRIIASALLVCPLAFLMGIPFPHGLRLLVGSTQTQIAWAWAANGFASVIAAPLAALIALERGSPELFLFAAIAYGVAGLLAKPHSGNVTQTFTGSL